MINNANDQKKAHMTNKHNATNQPDNAQLTQWLEQCGAGNQSAFRHLARALGQRMYGLAMRLSNYDAATAEDVVQEALIKLWQVAPKWTSGGSVNAYVSRLVYTTAMDMHRKKRPTDELPEDVSIPETATEGVVRREQRHGLIAGMKQLPQRQQDAVLLSYFHDQSQREVAAAMGTSEKAVESLLVRARKTLAAHMPSHMQEGGYLQ